MVRRVYDWVLGWADHQYGSVALFAIAFAESSFFPIPPDVLLMALALGKTQAAFRFALICSVGSVLGGLAGYLIGWQLMETVGQPILERHRRLLRFLRRRYRRFGLFARAGRPDSQPIRRGRL